MSERPFVSIIMLIYNAAPFLHESLGSLIHQTLKNIEIVCVNDGSKDDSLAIMRQYAEEDPRICIIDKPNGGYGHAMNRGLEAAKGEFIGILEPDDYADAEMFERLYQTASETNADIVKSDYYDYRSADGSSTYHPQLDHPDYPFPGKEYNVCYNAKEDPRLAIIPPCIWTAIYRKQMLDDNRITFNETPGASYQDTSFSFKAMACAESVIFIKEAFIHYRIDNENSSINSKSKIFSVCDEFRTIDAFLNEKKERRELFARVLQIHKMRTYDWNLSRITPEYRNVFASYVFGEFMKAESEGFVHEEDFTPEQWARWKTWFENYRYIMNAEQIIMNSPTYKIGSLITFVPRKIREILKRKGKV